MSAGAAHFIFIGQGTRMEVPWCDRILIAWSN
jgi:hypothetical protein